MRKAMLVGAILGCGLLSGEAFARGGGGGGHGGAGGGAHGGVGGAGRGGAYGHGYGAGYGGFGIGVGVGLGAGLYGGGLYGGGLYAGGYGAPLYNNYYYTPPPPYYPSYPGYPPGGPGYPPGGANPGVFPPQTPEVPPMPLPTYASGQQTVRPAGYEPQSQAPPSQVPVTTPVTPVTTPVNHQTAAVKNGNWAPIQLEVLVPRADARVYIDDKETTLAGSERIFVSPPLESGYAYSYKVKVVWLQDGQEVSQERQVRVSPGISRTVDFNGERLPPPSFESTRE